MDEKQLQQAYEQLGVPSDASIDEVEKRYSLLLKKNHARNTEEGKLELSAINQAYNTIMLHERKKAEAAYNEQNYAKYKWLNMEKVDHFFHYYKVHVLVAILIIALSAVGVKTYLDKKAEREAEARLPRPNIELLLFGDYNIGDTTGDLEKNILEQFPDWERVKTTVSYVPEMASSEFDIALQQKSMITLMTEKPDIYMLDQVNFDKLISQGAFKKLDDLKQSLDGADKSRIILAQTEKDTIEYVYAFNAKGSSIFHNTPLDGKDLLIAIREGAKLEDNALQLLDTLIQTSK